MVWTADVTAVVLASSVLPCGTVLSIADDVLLCVSFGRTGPKSHIMEHEVRNPGVHAVHRSMLNPDGSYQI